MPDTYEELIKIFLIRIKHEGVSEKILKLL